MTGTQDWVVSIQQPLFRMLVTAETAHDAVVAARARYTELTRQQPEAFVTAMPMPDDPETQTPDDVLMGAKDLLLLAERTKAQVRYRIRVREHVTAEGSRPYIDVYYALVLPDELGRVRRYWHHEGSFDEPEGGGDPRLFTTRPELFVLWEPPADALSTVDVQQLRLVAGAIVQACIEGGIVPSVEFDGVKSTIGVAGKTRHVRFRVDAVLGIEGYELAAASDEILASVTHTTDLPTPASARQLAATSVGWILAPDAGMTEPQASVGVLSERWSVAALRG